VLSRCSPCRQPLGLVTCCPRGKPLLQSCPNACPHPSFRTPTRAVHPCMPVWAWVPATLSARAPATLSACNPQCMACLQPSVPATLSAVHACMPVWAWVPATLSARAPATLSACNPQCMACLQPSVPATLSAVHACNPQCMASSACLQPSVHGQQCMLATLSAWPATLSARPAVHASNPQCTASSACLQPSVHGQLPSVHGPRPSVHGRGPSCWCAYPCMHATCGSIAGCHPLSPGCPKGYANHARMALLACTRDERMHAIRGACANSIGSEPGSTHA